MLPPWPCRVAAVAALPAIMIATATARMVGVADAASPALAPVLAAAAAAAAITNGPGPSAATSHGARGTAAGFSVPMFGSARRPLAAAGVSRPPRRAHAG